MEFNLFYRYYHVIQIHPAHLAMYRPFPVLYKQAFRSSTVCVVCLILKCNQHSIPPYYLNHSEESANSRATIIVTAEVIVELIIKLKPHCITWKLGSENRCSYR